MKIGDLVQTKGQSELGCPKMVVLDAENSGGIWCGYWVYVREEGEAFRTLHIPAGALVVVEE